MTIGQSTYPILEILTQGNQGSIDAGIVSSSNLSSGVVDFFAQSEYEMNYGPLNLIPQSYQDDLMRVCKDSDSAQFGLERFENLAETKLLSYNLDKSMTLIVGSKNARVRLEKEFEDKPSKLYGKPMKLSRQATYLGEEITLDSRESISATIRKRSGIVKKSILEIKNIVEGSRSSIA